MGIVELILIAVGLAMDAFAVSVCKGLATRKVETKHFLIAGAWFGGFQMLMPIIGFVLGVQFKGYITKIDHWIAFILLALIGISMIRESLDGDEVCPDDSMDAKTMLLLAIATSIDALAVGITFAFLDANIVVASILIGVITFVISAIGIKIGNIFGTKYKAKAEFAGGVILILIGLKILLSHLGIL